MLARARERTKVVGVLAIVLEEFAPVPVEGGQADVERPRRLFHRHQTHQDVFQELDLTGTLAGTLLGLLLRGYMRILTDMTGSDFGLVVHEKPRYSRRLEER